MRILFLLQTSPFPPTDGNRWKIFNLIEHMARRHQCDVLCFGDANDRDALRQAEQRLSGLRVLGVYACQGGPALRLRQALAMISQTTFPSSLRYRNADFVTAIGRTLRAQRYDVVHVDLMNLIWVRPFLGSVATVISLTDPQSLRYARRAAESGSLAAAFAARCVAASLRKHESRRLPRYDAVHVVSREDAEYLRAVHGLTNVEVVGISVDPAYLRLPSAPRNGDAVRVFSSGTLDEAHIRRPLREFLQGSWPRLRDAYPRCSLTYIGRGRGTANLSAWLKQQPGIHYYPFVEDYPSALAQSDLAVFFDRGGTGIKNRVMQAMAAGKATVGFRECFSGMEADDRVHCLMASDPQGLARHLETLLANPQYAQELGGQAREFVASRFTSEAINGRWESLYDALANHESPLNMEVVG